MKFAYADPPYPGQAKRHYASREIDHIELVNLLATDYPDGWALSTSSPALRFILPLCPPDVRVMAWVKPFASFKPGVNPAYAWEPVIVRGGRPRRRTEETVRDWMSANITLKKGTHGAKPLSFCLWLFSVLNMCPDDQLDDLYPGSGAVTEAWNIWKQHHTRGGLSGKEPAPKEED